MLRLAWSSSLARRKATATPSKPNVMADSTLFAAVATAAAIKPKPKPTDIDLVENADGSSPASLECASVVCCKE